MPNIYKIQCLAALAMLLPGVAGAHHFMDSGLPQTLPQGLLSGLAHPVIGLDHATFIVCAGYLLGTVPRGMWGAVAVAAGSLSGAALHLQGIGLPWGEAGVALSVVLAGVILMARRRIELPWLAVGLALAGLLHGHAYAESIFGAEAAPLGAYLAGFTMTQLGIMAAAFYLHRYVVRLRGVWSSRVAVGLGAAAGMTGVLFLVARVAG